MSAETEELSHFGRVKKLGSDLIKIVLTTDRSDIARGITSGF